MKNLLKMSLLALMIAGSVACKKEDKKDLTPPNNNPTDSITPEKKLEGSWKMSKFEQDGDATSSGTTIYTYTMIGSDFAGVITYNSDHTYTSTSSYTITMTMVMGGINNTTVKSIDATDHGTWEFDSNGDLEVTSAVSQVSQIMEISTLTSTKLEITSSVVDTQTQGGATLTVTGNSAITYER